MDKIKELISSDYDMNSIEWGRRPIITACAYMKHDIAKLLIEAGADVNLLDGGGTDALHTTCSQPGGSIETIDLLISNGADVNNLYGQYRFSNLLSACQHSTIEVVEYLIKLGADINQTNIFGDTPIMVAVKFGRDELAAKLMLSGADTYQLEPDKVSELKKGIADGNWKRRRNIMMCRNSMGMGENPVIGGSLDIFKQIVAYI